jgi:hypothetical protein
MNFHKETVTEELFDVLKDLMSIESLLSFRLVGGTALALQMGHRKSIDIDFFSNEKMSKKAIVASLENKFAGVECVTTSYSVNARIKGVRIDIFDDWSVPFKMPPLVMDGIRLGSLEDLAAFKLTAFTERREKKDYVDLYFLFKELGGLVLLQQYKNYNPLLSPKSLLFAMNEIDTAESNKSVMPEMLVPFSWEQAKISMKSVAREYFRYLQEQQGLKLG